MKISIVLLSRKRIGLLRDLLQSISDNSDDISNIEVIVGLDLDDQSSMSEVAVTENIYPFCQMIFRTRQFNMHHHINSLARMSTGDYVMVMNDDCRIITSGWDSRIKAEVLLVKEKWADDIFYIATKDSSIDKVGNCEYASFPFISRTAILAGGVFMDQTFPCHGADVATWRIYNTIGRVHKTECFEIDHILHSSPELLAQKDETAGTMIGKTFASPMNFWDSDISGVVNRLRDYINDYEEKEVNAEMAAIYESLE